MSTRNARAQAHGRGHRGRCHLDCTTSRSRGGVRIAMKAAATTLEAAGIAEILRALPHRYPFLLVDRIINIRGDESGVGIKNVTFNEPQFQGHFPGNPVFPGILILEGMAQTAGVICVRASTTHDRAALVYFLTVDKAKFRKPVIPGDTVEYHVTKIN